MPDRSIFLAFKARGYLPYNNSGKHCNDFTAKVNSKKYLDKKSRNRKFDVGSKVLVRSILGSKFAIRGYVCKVIKQFDFDSILLLNLVSGRVFRCSLERVSPLPPDSNLENSDEEAHYDGEDHGGQSDVDNGASSPTISSPAHRRSKRASIAPSRLTYH